MTFTSLGSSVQIVFGRAILSRNECKVQCVAQTCLEKGRAEEQVYGECKGEKRRKGKQIGWRIFILFYSKADHRRSGTSHNHAAQLKGGLQLLEKRGLCVGNGV